MIRIAVVMTLLIVANTINAQTTIHETSSTRPIDLFRAAIDSPTGSVRTQVYGPLAQKVQQAIGAPGTPVFADIKTIQAFQQEGCKRLAMTLSAPQHQMKTTDGGFRPFSATWTLNVCRDGSPPTEGIDLAQAAKMFERGGKPVSLPR